MSYEEKPAKGVLASGIIGAAAVLSIVGVAIGGAPGYRSAQYWMDLGIMAVLFVAVWMVLKALKPQVFKRRWGTDPYERGYELVLMMIAAVLSVVISTVSAVDYFRLHIGYLGGWWPLVGMVLISIGATMFQQTLMAYAPHDRSRYGELPTGSTGKGPYGQIRHPLPGLLLITMLGVPLLLSSWLGLIGWGLLLVVMIVYVSMEDRWRLMHYEWYYEYSTQATKKMIPMIW
jgi:protein-S-isoprenylcysteine O-methyltransferase Ste14